MIHLPDMYPDISPTTPFTCFKVERSGDKQKAWDDQWVQVWLPLSPLLPLQLPMYLCVSFTNHAENIITFGVLWISFCIPPPLLSVTLKSGTPSIMCITLALY